MKEFLQRAADRSGFNRDVYNEKLIPNDIDSIVIVPVFADFKTEFIISSLLYDACIKKRFNKNYVIVATYPGRATFYDADEVWSCQGVGGDIQRRSKGWDIGDPNVLQLLRSLNRYFANVLQPDWGREYYDFYLKEKFWTLNADVVLPAIPSLKIEYARKLEFLDNLVLVPTPKEITIISRSGREEKSVVSKKVYEDLIDLLKREKFNPVTLFNSWCYDLSSKSIALSEEGLTGVVSIGRACNKVLDFFGDFFGIGVFGRTSCLSIFDRKKFFDLNLGEILAISSVHGNVSTYFSNPGPLLNGSGHEWIIEAVVNRLKEVQDQSLPATPERFLANRNLARKKTFSRLGLQFFKPDPIGATDGSSS